MEKARDKSEIARQLLAKMPAAERSRAFSVWENPRRASHLDVASLVKMANLAQRTKNGTGATLLAAELPEPRLNQKLSVKDLDSPTAHSLLRPFSVYVWWETADETLEHPQFLIAQVMARGTYLDFTRLEAIFSHAVFVHALKCAQAGMFNIRSWHFWHYRLGLASSDRDIPALPTRNFPAQGISQ
jgi:hypothetical protein